MAPGARVALMDIPMFFVFGLPRSGTTWLGNLVARCNKEGLVCHEAHNSDFRMDTTAPFRPWEAQGYVDGPRHDRVTKYLSDKRPTADFYGEVTPRLRYFSAQILNRYPHARHIHLVRDPRATVRSMIQFGYYSASGGRRHRVVAPYPDKWTQIERTAWAWAFGHHLIRQTSPVSVRLEDLLTNWTTVEMFADHLKIRIEKGKWEKSRTVKVNPSNETMAPWESWTEEEQDSLVRMCGTEARQYGYLET